jgi:hypothetical protein
MAKKRLGERSGWRDLDASLDELMARNPEFAAMVERIVAESRARGKALVCGAAEINRWLDEEEARQRARKTGSGGR